MEEDRLSRVTGMLGEPSLKGTTDAIATVRRLLVSFTDTLDVLDCLPAMPMVATGWHWWSRQGAPIHLPRVSWMLRSLTLWHIDRVLSGAEKMFTAGRRLGSRGQAKLMPFAPSPNSGHRFPRDQRRCGSVAPWAECVGAGPVLDRWLAMAVNLQRPPRSGPRLQRQASGWHASCGSGARGRSRYRASRHTRAGRAVSRSAVHINSTGGNRARAAGHPSHCVADTNVACVVRLAATRTQPPLASSKHAGRRAHTTHTDLARVIASRADLMP